MNGNDTWEPEFLKRILDDIILPRTGERLRRYEALGQGSAMSVNEWRFLCAPLGTALAQLVKLVAICEPSVAPKYHLSVAIQLFHEAYLMDNDEEFLPFRIAWEALWAHLAFPHVKVDAQTAAQLVATSTEGAGVDRSPWPAVVFEFPEEVFGAPICVSLLDTSGVSPNNLGEVALSVSLDRAQPMTPASGTLYEASTVSELCQGIARRDALPDNALHRARHLAAIGRVTLGTVAALQSKLGTVRRRQNGKLRVHRGPLTGGTYYAGLPVKCNVTREVADWVAGRRQSLRRSSVRWLVRGHWRQQACGKDRGQRRRTWVAPYWKGPERAAALVRAHEVSA